MTINPFSSPPAVPGTEHPDLLGEVSPTIVRSFAFVDLCRFTEYANTHGPHAAVQILSEYRTLIRRVTERRGVRVAKWLGDGAMLVGVHPGALACAVVEIAQRCDSTGMRMRGGCATGQAIIAEGDDYIGGPVNLAARLCDAAGAGMVLADAETTAATPNWVPRGPARALRIRGFGHLDGIVPLHIPAAHDPGTTLS